LEILQNLASGRVGEGTKNSSIVIHISILASLLISINPWNRQLPRPSPRLLGRSRIE
jgi:hypothetical protein